MSQSLPLNATTEKERPWLQAVYEARRQRTVRLVKAAVDRLREDGQAVTIEAICQLSKELDPDGKGIQKAGILGNGEAHAYYQQHSRSYQIYRKRRYATSSLSSAKVTPTRLQAGRDGERVRRHYLHWGKAALVERLLTVEQEYTVLQERLVRLQFALIELQQEQRNVPHSRG